MTGKTKISTVLLPKLIAALLLGSLINPSTSMASGQQSRFNAWLVALKEEVLKTGIPRKTLDMALNGLNRIPRVIELDRNQVGSRITLEEYLSRAVPEDRVSEGRKRLGENRILLNKLAINYGVQPRFLIALWGVETDFGRVTGSFPVIGSLVTLTYDGRRSSLFRKELIHALHILDEGHISLAQMKGSWAGAMGQLQFMPSTFRNFAVDFDGDGRIDIWKSQEDAFASAANYLSHSGWIKDQTWGQEVRLPTEPFLSSIYLKERRRLSEWQALGVRPVDGHNFPAKELIARIVQPDGPMGRAFLVYSNYQIILRWNRSHNFALSVGILSDSINSP